MSGNKAAMLKRKEKDIFKLRCSKHKIEPSESDSTYQIEFCGTPSLTQALKIPPINLESGGSTSICPTTTPTRAHPSASSIKYTIPTSTIGTAPLTQFWLSVPRCDQPDLDSDVLAPQYLRCRVSNIFRFFCLNY